MRLLLRVHRVHARVCERQRQTRRNRETDTETDTETQRQTQRQRHREGVVFVPRLLRAEAGLAAPLVRLNGFFAVFRVLSLTTNMLGSSLFGS